MDGFLFAADVLNVLAADVLAELWHVCFVGLLLVVVGG